VTGWASSVTPSLSSLFCPFTQINTTDTVKYIIKWCSKTLCAKNPCVVWQSAHPCKNKSSWFSKCFVRGALLPLFTAQIASRWRGWGEGRGTRYRIHLHQLVNTYTLTPERRGGAPTECSGACRDHRTYTRCMDGDTHSEEREQCHV